VAAAKHYVIYKWRGKWILDLGKKADKSLYNKKDELTLVQLTERIKLSLKFILA